MTLYKYAESETRPNDCGHSVEKVAVSTLHATALYNAVSRSRYRTDLSRVLFFFFLQPCAILSPIVPIESASTTIYSARLGRFIDFSEHAKPRAIPKFSPNAPNNIENIAE